MKTKEEVLSQLERYKAGYRSLSVFHNQPWRTFDGRELTAILGKIAGLCWVLGLPMPTTQEIIKGE